MPSLQECIYSDFSIVGILVFRFSSMYYVRLMSGDFLNNETPFHSLQ